MLDHLRSTVGLWTGTLDSLAPSELGPIAASIEEMGYPSLWFSEAWGREALTQSALLLAGSRSLVVATGIATIWGRDAVAAKNAARTLSAFSQDRFILGLGISHQPLVERLRNHRYDAPVDTMRTYLEAMDAAPMLARESDQGVVRIVAALGPRMVRLAAELTEGAFSYLSTTDHSARVRQAIGDGPFLCVEQAVVLGESTETWLERAHQHLEFYTGLENYRANWRRFGFSDEDFVRGGSQRLCEALVFHGDEAAVQRRVNEHFSAGADHVVLQVLGASPTEPPLVEWRRLAKTFFRN